MSQPELALPFTLQQMQRDFADAIQEFLHSLVHSSLFDGDPYLLFGEAFARKAHEQGGGPIEPQWLEGVSHFNLLTDLYRYAFHGEGFEGVQEQLEGPLESFDHLLRLKPERPVMRTLNQAVARCMLDAGEDLTLEQIAYLGLLQLKSVRNAATKGFQDPLKTRLVNGQSMVKAKDAREWLRRRRGFVPTANPELLPVPLPATGFTSGADVAAFMERRLASLRINEQDLAVRGEALGLGPRSLDDIRRGCLDAPLDELATVAELLALDPQQFIAAIASAVVANRKSGQP